MTATKTTMKYLTTALLVLLMAGTAMGATLNVCPSGCTYTTIQAAVNAANASEIDTIIVADGVYNENVNVNKTVVITSENNHTGTFIIAANPDISTITVNADDVEIYGFTVTGATGTGAAGIYISHHPNQPNGAMVDSNFITWNTVGIKIHASKNNSFYGNSIVENTGTGIFLIGAVSACNNFNDFHYNDILRNGVLQADGSYQYQVRNSNAGDGNMENNYWGTTNDSIVGKSIYKSGYQCYDVHYIPILQNSVGPTNPLPELPTIALVGVGALGMIGILSRRRNE